MKNRLLQLGDSPRPLRRTSEASTTFTEKVRRQNSALISSKLSSVSDRVKCEHCIGDSPRTTFTEKVCRQNSVLVSSKLSSGSDRVKCESGAGFTLVEMLVTLSIFSMGFVMIAAIYVGITNAQNRAKVSVEYLNEGGLVFEQIAREIRGKTIDSCSFRCEAPSYICLTDLANGKTFLRFNSTASSVEINRGAECSPDVTWTRLSNPSIKISHLQFWTFVANDRQPLTTVLMTVEPRVPTSSAVPINLQTSISSRVFLPAKPTP